MHYVSTCRQKDFWQFLKEKEFLILWINIPNLLRIFQT